jgi:hypothetical protein
MKIANSSWSDCAMMVQMVCALHCDGAFAAGACPNPVTAYDGGYRGYTSAPFALGLSA